jgi:DNA (cytosine-5)-methyltransferase 1
MQIELTHGSLFSGIGGFEIGAERAGIKNIWACEIEKYQRNILKNNFKSTQLYYDIKDMQRPRQVDIISGGFPCQDISIAGKGGGINGERSGLWNEMYRIIREVRPGFVIIENSPALLIRGFEKVLCDLSKIGYDAEWKCLSNKDFGYPHKRERVYIIAYTNKKRFKSDNQEHGKFKSIFKQQSPNTRMSHSIAKRIYEMPDSSDIRINNGFRNWTHRVSCIGNSVNPSLTHYLFKCINQRELELKQILPLY